MESSEEKMRILLERLSGEMQVANSLGANVTHEWLEKRIKRIEKCLKGDGTDVQPTSNTERRRRAGTQAEL